MFQEKVYSKRLNNLKEKLEPDTLYLISKPSHIEYLTGFRFLVPSEREAFFVCDKNNASLIYSSFSPISNFEFLNYYPGTYPSQLKENIEKILSINQIKKIMYDNKTLFVNELDALNSITDIETHTIKSNFIDELIMIKDKNEIELIKQACEITKNTFEIVKSKIKKGMTEIEIADLIHFEFEKNNIKQSAFPTIVAFGANCALPHHQPGNDVLEEDTVILIDMGAKYQNYCADMTRTFWFGNNPSGQFIKIEKIVLDAYNNARSVAKEYINKKVLAKDLDNAARVLISNQGFGDNFIHTTGHGLGIDIHEQPSLNWQNPIQIKENMIITIEPGIYIEGEIGYRHEDTFVTTKEGIEILT